MKWFIQSFLILIVFAACSKQELPRFKSEINQTEIDRVQLQSCLGFRPYDHQFSHANTLKLFNCTKWFQEFPQIYQALLKISPKDWDQLLSPLDNKFFNDVEGRKKFLGLLKDLDKKNAINDLGILGKKVFSSPLIKILSENKNQDSLTKILKIFNLPLEKRNQIAKFSKSAVYAIGKSEKSLKNDLMPVFKNNNIRTQKLWLYNYLAKKYLVGDLNEDLKVLGELFNKKSHDFWFYSWLQDPAVNRDVFAEIFNYSSIKAKGVTKDVRYLKMSLTKGVLCQEKTQQHVVDVKPEVKDIVQFLKTSSQTSFFEKQLDHKAKLSIFSNFCEKITIENEEQSEFVPVYERLFDHVQDFFLSRPQFEWIRGLHRATSITNNPFYIIDFMSGDFYSQIEDVLVVLNNDDQNTLTAPIYDLFKNVPLSDYESIYTFLNLLDDSEVKPILDEVIKLWLSLSDSEKESINELMEIFLNEDIHTFELLNLGNRLIEKFPNLISELKNDYQTAEHPELLSETIHVIANQFNDEDVQEELSYFFGEQHMARVIKALTFGLNESPADYIEAQSAEDIYVPYVVNEDEQKIKLYAKCIQDIRTLEKKGLGYYELIAAYPESCMQIKDGAITHKLFTWFKSIDLVYAEQYGDQYVLFDDKGFLKNESLSQVLNLILVSNEVYLQNNKDLTLHDFVGDLREELLVKENYKILDSLFHLLGKLYEKDTFLVERYYKGLITKIVNKNDHDIKKFLKPLSSYLVDAKKTNYILEDGLNKESCKNLNANLGVNPCLNQAELKKGMNQLWKILFTKYDGAKPMAEELVALLHPDGGVQIPFSGKKALKYSISLEEIVRFFHHMSSPDDLKQIIYKTQNNQTSSKENTLAQLEVVIRDISFLNNFYGAYFKNTVAAAKNYKQKVSSLKKEVGMMEKSGGAFRKLKIFPEETEWKLFNITQTYDSLIHVDDDFKLGNKTYHYGPMMQSILALVTQSSSPDVQKFTAFWFPNTEFGDRHQGRFLTQFVNMSGMRHLSQYIHNRMGTNIQKAITEKHFQTLNKLPGRFTLSKLQEKIRFVADHYAKNDSDVFYEMNDDLVTWISGLSYGELRIAENVLVNLMLLFSDSKEEKLDQYLPLVDKFFELYRPIKKYWPKERRMIDLLKDINPLLDSFVKRNEVDQDARVWWNQALSIIDTLFLDGNNLGLNLLSESFKSDPKELLSDIFNLVDQFKNLNNQWSLDKTQKFDQTYSSFISNSHLEFSGLKNWLAGSLTNPSHKLEVLRLFHFLSQTIKYEGESRSRLYVVIDQLFNKESATLEALLQTASSSFSFK
jgi:hypothetical protein